jgi:hypothetical protein
MMATVTILPGSSPSLEVLLAMVREQYPEAKEAIVIVFDAEGSMHTHYRCNEQEMALAGSRLLYLVNQRNAVTKPSST